MLTNFNYQCPLCQHSLSGENNINFVVENDKGSRSVMTLSPIPGVYEYSIDVDFTVRRGEKLKFHCPNCMQNLTSKTHPKYVEIDLILSYDVFFKIFFSPVCGDKSSFVMIQGVLEKYDENFFSMALQKAG